VLDGYDEAAFLGVLQSRTKISATQRNPENGRLLIAYERHSASNEK
jgi:hypothetical protein